MKSTVSFLLTAITLGSALMAHATVLRVNNTPAITAPYATLQAAYNVAIDGDTIYLESSTYSYEILESYKRLVIIGTGYFLNNNPETQANTFSSTVTGIYFYTGSSGSKIMGLTLGNLYFQSPNLQDFVIIRNHINSVYASFAVSNILIAQNYIPYGLNGQFENSIFRNNFLDFVNLNSLNNTLAVYNNVMGGTTLTLAQCYNNIFFGSGSFTNCTTFNNVCSATQVPAGNGNQLNVNMDNVFLCFSVCPGASPDAIFQLKAGSPAIAAGNNGENCGMYGGSDPYVLSGMPPIPAIYYFNYNYNNSTINVDMKVKSHN